MRRPMQEHDALERELKELVLFEERGIDPTGKWSKMDKKAIKARVRMIKNRLAAKRSREHARTYVQELEGTLEALQSKNEVLARRLAALEAENDKLKRSGGLSVAGGGDVRGVGEGTKDRNSEPAAGCGPPLPLGSCVDPAPVASPPGAVRAAVPVVSSTRRPVRNARRAGTSAVSVHDGVVDVPEEGGSPLGTPTSNGGLCVTVKAEEAAPTPLAMEWGDVPMADDGSGHCGATFAASDSPETSPHTTGGDISGEFVFLDASRSDEDDAFACFDKSEHSYFPSFDDMVCAPEWTSAAGGDGGMMCAL
mmetsp:Transcript_6279/g.16050  ORF Transcript_6279/g.16050 Transcript_6279/m.16050 type:complete len:308 (-) Transcript_6279:232-1155(-)